MKKIQLSKETLRVLTAQEASDVAGGATQTCIPRAACGESRPVIACETARCTTACPPATDTCNCPPPVTTNCPPATSDCPATSEIRCTETRVRPRCVIP